MADPRREATWTDIRKLLPIDTDRDRLNDDLVTIARQQHLPVLRVFDTACDALAMGIEADRLTHFLMVHYELNRR